jgi:hypothetical protein
MNKLTREDLQNAPMSELKRLYFKEDLSIQDLTLLFEELEKRHNTFLSNEALITLKFFIGNI